MTLHTSRDGIKRLPLHLATFGLLGALGTFFGGWGCAATLVAWRAYEEWLDYRLLRDDLAKAAIDFASQTLPAIIVALARFA